MTNHSSITARRSRWVGCLLLLHLAGCGSPSRDEVLPLAKLEGKWVFTGDSLTAGDTVPSEVTFVSLIGKKSDLITTVNQGRSGWPTTSFLRRKDEVLQDLPADAAVVFLQLGANDIRVHGHSDTTIQQTAQNMGKIVDLYRQRAPKAEIILVSHPTMVLTEMTEPLRKAGFGEHSFKYLAALGPAYQQIAREKGCGFINLYPTLEPGDTTDGAHPNANGHRKIADTIWTSVSGSN